jgi:hypothetical protein
MFRHQYSEVKGLKKQQTTSILACGQYVEIIPITTLHTHDSKHKQNSINKPDGSATVASYSSMTISFETSSDALASTS